MRIVWSVTHIDNVLNPSYNPIGIKNYVPVDNETIDYS